MRSLIAIVVAGSVVLTACGGGAGPSAQDEQDDTEYAEEQEEAAASDPAATEDPSAVSALTKKRRDATFKVTYKWTSGDDTPANETWYQKPPLARIDFGGSTESHWMAQYVLADGHFVCETSDGKSTCWKGGGEAKAAEELSFTATIMIAFEGLLSDPAFGTTKSDRTIAGQRASCATARNVLMLGFAEITACYAGNGVPLLLEWKAGEDMLRMEATSYTTSVTNKDFELLATPQTY